MRNKYRLSIMIVLIIMLFMYIAGVVGVAYETNFAFTLAALILSISMTVDTFAKQNKIAEGISFVLEVLALLIMVMIPNLKHFVLLKKLMSTLDTNVLLMLALFFTFAGQWATEIKIKDIKNRKEK
jgi:hypothetical protein